MKEELEALSRGERTVFEIILAKLQPAVDLRASHLEATRPRGREEANAHWH